MNKLKMNNNGFATSIILFGLLILFLAVISVLFFNMNNSYMLNNSLKKNLLSDLEDDNKNYQYLKYIDGVNWYFASNNLEESSNTWVNQIGEENFVIYNFVKKASDGSLVLSGEETSYGKLSVENLNELTLYIVVKNKKEGISNIITTGNLTDDSNMIRLNVQDGYLVYANDTLGNQYTSEIDTSKYNVYVVSYDVTNNQSILYINGVKVYIGSAGLFDGNYYLGNYNNSYNTEENNYYLVAISNVLHSETQIIENSMFLMNRYAIQSK